jgi:hypothetical protein
MKTRLLACLLPLFLLAPLSAQEPPKPGPQHQKLAANAGTWDAAIEMMGPDGKMMPSKGASVQTMGPGGFWLLDDFVADLGGQPFHGKGATGFDPLKGKYVGTWIDSMSPSLLVLEGDFDASGKVLTMTGTAPGFDGKPAKYRMVTTFVDAKTMRFEMFVAGEDGKEMKMLSIAYTRRADDGGKPKTGK